LCSGCVPACLPKGRLLSFFFRDEAASWVFFLRSSESSQFPFPVAHTLSPYHRSPFFFVSSSFFSRPVTLRSTVILGPFYCRGLVLSAFPTLFGFAEAFANRERRSVVVLLGVFFSGAPPPFAPFSLMAGFGTFASSLWRPDDPLVLLLVSTSHETNVPCYN